MLTGGRLIARGDESGVCVRKYADMSIQVFVGQFSEFFLECDGKVSHQRRLCEHCNVLGVLVSPG